MTLLELFLIAVGLSMDAFAVSICCGLTMQKVTVKKVLIIGFYFGVFQAGMPVIGYLVASLFAGYIIAYDHWVAFLLLCFLGGKMISGSLKKEDDGVGNKEISLTPAVMLPFAVATSIDALAVGVSFAFLKADIAPAALLIGVTTLVISVLGVKIGNVFGLKYKSKAEFAGGVILILIGVKIVLEHSGIFG